jgi:hypothetical protein
MVIVFLVIPLLEISSLFYVGAYPLQKLIFYEIFLQPNLLGSLLIRSNLVLFCFFFMSRSVLQLFRFNINCKIELKTVKLFHQEDKNKVQII